MARGFEKPPWWAVVVMVVGAVALVVGLPMAMGRGQLDPAEVQRLNADAAAQRAAESSAADLPTLAVLGDSYTAGTQYGGRGDDGWARRLANAREWGVCVDAGGGSGFVAGGAAESPFTDEERLGWIVECAPDVVVIVIAANDAGQPVEDVRAAVEEVFGHLTSELPEVPVVTVGPIFRTAETPPEVQTLHDVIAQETQQAGFFHVDARDWLAERPDLLAEDGAHPTSDGHAYLAKRIGEALDSLGLPA